MQTMGQTAGTDRAGRSDRKRIETVVETLATLRSGGESISELAHDARNMVTALGLYCDLLEEPGVLATPYLHYGAELRLVASASRRLVEKLVAIDSNLGLSREQQPRGPASLLGKSRPWIDEAEKPGSLTPGGSSEELDRGLRQRPERNQRWDLLPAVPVANLAAELLADRNLLSALAGPSIGLTLETDGGAQPVRLTGEDLTRVMVNLVKNAAEAMPGGGRIHIGLSERPAQMGTADCLLLTVEDNGPGIPAEALDAIFNSGYSTHIGVRGKGQVEGHGKSMPKDSGWPTNHRGLGLAISRSIVEAAGGRISAGNRGQGGARFEIELPVRQTSF